MKILMVLDMPWTKDLGAPRVSYQLAESLRKHGHEVEKFALNDAFPTSSRFSRIFEGPLFPRKARQYVKRNAYRFDLIQAEPGNLPFSKAELGFSGRLIVRSNGLAHLYELSRNRFRWDRSVRAGSFGGRVLRWVAQRMSKQLRRIESSFVEADAIVVINADEYRYVSETLGHESKTSKLPLGLTASQLTAFDSHASSPSIRLASCMVTFIGSWTPRKGVADLPKIIRSLRTARPEIHFRLMGTGRDKEFVLNHFPPSDRANIEVIPSYSVENVPKLLANATVGILPSHVEGFPFAVLEHLAAGVPIVAYDVPGPREMLSLLGESTMVAPGQVDALSDRVHGILAHSLDRYASLSTDSRRVAQLFRWEPVVRHTLEIYHGRKPHPSRNGPEPFTGSSTEAGGHPAHSSRESKSAT